MKAGYVTLSVPPAKRRWKGLALAVVLALVVFSLLVPLAFLLGLYNRFPYGSSSTDRASSSVSRFPNPDRDVDVGAERVSSEDEEVRVDNLIRKLAPTLPKIDRKTNGHATRDDKVTRKEGLTSESANYASHSQDPAKPEVNGVKPHLSPNSKTTLRSSNVSASSGKETQKSCQVEFGSYCLWSIEHKEVMKDPMVKRLKDQLYVARAYYPSIAKLKGQDKLSRGLKLNIQEHERMLSDAIVDTDLPTLVEKSVQKMDQVITAAKACRVECHNVEKKLRQILDLAEDEAHFHMKQSAFLYHLGVQTMPKSQHCLSMRLTLEYFNSQPESSEHLHSLKIDDPAFQHLVIFSRNILAVSVVINSTVTNSGNPGDLVFHILTDEQNFYAMKLWFSRNSYKDAALHVQNVEDLYLDQQLWPAASEFRVSIRSSDHPSSLQMRTEYLSIFGRLLFSLPEIFKNLRRLVVLDDDVVVQRDLSPLWSLDMHGKVNGAVQFCEVRLGQLKPFLGRNSFDSTSCAWMSGLNVIDLEKWREHDVTRVYQRLLQEMKQGQHSTIAALPASLLAFRDLIHPLDPSWLLSGLGHNHGIGGDAISRAGALHFNGNMKPWLELGIPRYKKYWKRFLTQEDRFMEQCKVNP